MPSLGEWEYFKTLMPDVKAFALTRAGMRTIFNTVNIMYSEVSGQWIIREPGGRSKAIGLTDIGGNHTPSATLEMAPWALTQKIAPPDPLPAPKRLPEAQVEIPVVRPTDPNELGPEATVDKKIPNGEVATRKAKHTESDTERMAVPPDFIDCIVDLLLEAVKSLPPTKKAPLWPQVTRLIGMQAERRAEIQQYHRAALADGTSPVLENGATK